MSWEHAIRPMAEDDDLTPLTSDDPFGWSLAAWQELDRAMPEPAGRYWVVEADGRLVGYAMALPLPVMAGGYGPAYGRVDPAYRRRGIGTALRREVHAVLRGAVAGVHVSHDEADPDAAAAIARWGLTESGRHAESVLDLTAYDAARFAELGEVAGIDFVPLDPAWPDAVWAELHAFATARYLDSPDSGGDAEFVPLEVFRQPLRDPWSLLVAERDGVRVGLTYVMRRSGTTTETNTLFTGVVPEARGLGLATALKARQAVAMAAAGIERHYTQNMDGNEPILRANATLGFAPSFRYVDAREALTAPGSA